MATSLAAAFEYAKVETYWSPGDELDSLDWRRISDQAGRAMLVHFAPEVMCSPPSAFGQHASKVARKFRSCWLRIIADDHVAKYARKDFAILVRRSRAVSVGLRLTENVNEDAEPVLCIDADIDGGDALHFMQPVVRNLIGVDQLRLKDVANSIHASLVVNQKCTLQSKITWRFNNRVITKNNKIWQKRTTRVMRPRPAARHA